MSTILFTCPECEVCGKSAEVELDCAAELRWRHGEHVQHVFPDMTADDREMLISGTHPACWQALYGSDEDV